MSKKNRLSKEWEQGMPGDLFAVGQDSGTTKGGGTSRKDQKIELFSRLEEQRTLTTGTVDKISEEWHLLKAFGQVKRNDGAAGTDGVTLGEYELSLRANIKQLQTQLKAGTYEPSAVRGLEMEKPNGGTRLLGIPTIGDRVVQQCIQTELANSISTDFSQWFKIISNGFKKYLIVAWMKGCHFIG